MHTVHDLSNILFPGASRASTGRQPNEGAKQAACQAACGPQPDEAAVASGLGGDAMRGERGQVQHGGQLAIWFPRTLAFTHQ